MNYPILPKNWNNLPNEIKIEVVKHLDVNSRLALRSCSVDDWKLVESVPFRKIHFLRLTEEETGYHILLKENYYNETEHQFKTFKEFQEKILKIFNNADYIKKLTIRLENPMENIKLMPRNQKIKVNKLSLGMHRPEDCLQQIDSTFLKKLILRSRRKHVSDELCDMPQFNSVDKLFISGYTIRDDQLMKIKSRKLEITSSRNLTVLGIYEYIKKRTSEPNSEKLSFSGLNVGPNNEVIGKISKRCQGTWEWFAHPILREMSVHRLRTNYTQAPSNFRKVVVVRIGFQHWSGHYGLYLEKNSHNRTEFELPYQSRERIQEILTEEMVNIDYIKRLEVTLQCQAHCWRLLPEGSSNRITVGHLEMSCDKVNEQSAIDLLEQIEPGHLKCIELCGENVLNNIYDMQQVIQADYIKSPHANIQDCQLMKLSATKISFGTARDRTTEYGKITASGANNFIKKCLLDLKKRNYDFELVLFYQSKHQEFVSALFEGLDIFSMENDPEMFALYPSEVIVNSYWEGIKLKLMIYRQYLKGERIEV